MKNGKCQMKPISDLNKRNIYILVLLPFVVVASSQTLDTLLAAVSGGLSCSLASISETLWKIDFKSIVII